MTIPISAPGTDVAVPSVTAGNLEVPTDKDTFSFDAVSGQKYRFTTILGTLDDSTLTLLGTDGTTVLASNDNFFNGNPAAFIYWTAPATGKYHLQVASAGGQYLGTYEAAVSIDDFGDYAGVAGPVAVSSSTAGAIEIKFDSDWFSFTATAGKWYRFQADAAGLADPFLALFSSTQLLTSNDNYQGSNATIFWQAPSSATYFLKVTGHSGSGGYQLGVTELVDDHGDDAANATLVSVPSNTAGNLERPNDADWFAFDVVADNRYRIEGLLNSLADSVLKLYAADGATKIGENDDYRGPGSRIDFTAGSTGRLYASITSRNSSYDGTYHFNLLQLETVPPTGASTARRRAQPLPSILGTWIFFGAMGAGRASIP